MDDRTEFPGIIIEEAHDRIGGAEGLEVGERQKNPGRHPGKPDQEKAKHPVHDEDRPGKGHVRRGQQKEHLYNG